MIAYLTLILFYCQPSKYTLSRKQRCTADGVPGIGWSDEGIEKYNEFYNLVKKDRTLNGVRRALLTRVRCKLLSRVPELQVPIAVVRKRLSPAVVP